jgi:AmmeMemoRadiSam system protein A
MDRIPSEQRRLLLELAREAVRAALTGEEPPPIPDEVSHRTEPTAAFVTIRSEATGALRGCRGECPARRPLPECVRHAAVSSALHDPRFPPVARHELSEVRFEISALSAPVPIEPGAVQVGTHGLLLESEGGAGLLLPQVPANQGWDRRAYLDGLCAKAGLEPGAWLREDVSLSAFEAQVWAEPGFGS